MTRYEILDLRATYGERVMSASKSWLTITFAVFAAAYYLRSDADLFAKMALVSFYGFATFFHARVAAVTMGFMKSLANEAIVDMSSEDTTTEAKELVRADSAQPIATGTLILMCLSFLALSYYTFAY